MKEVQLVRMTVERRLLHEGIDHLPIAYLPHIKRVRESTDHIELDSVEDEVIKLNLPIVHFVRTNEVVHKDGVHLRIPELVREDFYIVWTPEVEQAIGVPMKEFESLSSLIEMQGDMLRNQRRRINDYHGRITHANNWTFWRRLKFLFDRISI